VGQIPRQGKWAKKAAVSSNEVRMFSYSLERAKFDSYSQEAPRASKVVGDRLVPNSLKKILAWINNVGDF
jgi:hypothetical protein